MTLDKKFHGEYYTGKINVAGSASCLSVNFQCKIYGNILS